jgi:hypothetical protein
MNSDSSSSSLWDSRIRGHLDCYPTFAFILYYSMITSSPFEESVLSKSLDGKQTLFIINALDVPDKSLNFHHGIAVMSKFNHRNYHGILYVCVFLFCVVFFESFFPLLNKNLGTFINNVCLNGDREFHLLYETVIKTQ